jgi:uncharacterized repeat protein (TIGR01451 family)
VWLALAWLVLASLVLVLGPATARAASGSYATVGTGTYAQSLWWLDFSAYSNSTAAGAGQALSFTLPSGAGTLSTTVTLSGSTTLQAVAIPAWSGGGAIGHGAYNGISGAPDLYWLGQNGTGTVSLTGISVKDAAGNARSFTLFAADGENTNSGESIKYTSTAPWKLIDTITYYGNYNGTLPSLAGTGTAAVTETGVASGDGNYNASYIFGTLSPTQVSAALNGNEAVMYAIALAPVTLTVSVAGRLNTSDQFTATVGYTSPAASLAAVSTSGSATTVTTGAISAISGNSQTLGVSMLAGSVSALSAYAGSIACTNSGAGATGYGGTATVLPSGTGTSFTVTPQAGDSIACTLTLTPTQTLTGTVYGDANHDSALDNGETGTGVSGLYVKLAAYSGGACQSPATAAAAVTAATGVYSLAAVTPGSYCLVLTNSSALTNVTPYLPAGYVGTEAASGIRTLSVSASPAPVQNFGWFSGSTASVVVFTDNGSASATANDGVQEATEPGIANVVVTAAAAGSTIASATTGGSGSAVLWLPASAQGTSITVVPTAPTGDVPTGGSAGTTGGTYVRPAVTFTLARGVAYSGVTFGLIPASMFAPEGAQSIVPGGVVFYPHRFTAGSGGQVSFALSAVANPAVTGWNQLIYLDTSCSGQYSAADTQISAPVAVTANQAICILVREFAPANAPANGSLVVTVSATLAYSGSAAPAAATLTETDRTTVSGSGRLALTKQVQNVTAGGAYATSDTALPAQTLQYQVTVENLGSTPVSSLVINDATPAFTTFVAASCPAAAALPPGLTACSVAVQPTAGGTGALQWTFAGTLAAGGQTAVTFQVQITP